MKVPEALGQAALAAGAATLEAHGALAIGAGGAGPDLLVALAVGLAGRPGGSLCAAVLLGVLRDALAGGPAGQFAAGYLVAALLARAALGRARRRGLASAAGVVLLGATAAWLLPAAVAALQGVPLLFLAREVATSALLTAAFSPLALVPAAAVETLLAPPHRVDLARPIEEAR